MENSGILFRLFENTDMTVKGQGAPIVPYSEFVLYCRFG